MEDKDKEKSIIEKEKGENGWLRENEFWEQAENVIFIDFLA